MAKNYYDITRRWLAFAGRRDWFSNWRIRDIATAMPCMCR
nr:Uncharacterised protein [Klebsiella pneumoniae]